MRHHRRAHALGLRCCIQGQRRRGEESVDKTFQLRCSSWRCDVEDVCDCCAKQTPCVSCSSGCGVVGHPLSSSAKKVKKVQQNRTEFENVVLDVKAGFVLSGSVERDEIGGSLGTQVEQCGLPRRTRAITEPRFICRISVKVSTHAYAHTHWTTHTLCSQTQLEFVRHTCSGRRHGGDNGGPCT